jgi:hypothetical protein
MWLPNFENIFVLSGLARGPEEAVGEGQLGD